MAILHNTEKSACLLNLENGDILDKSIQRLLDEGIEVLVVDNNSHDSTAEVLKKYEGKIKYWRWDCVKGQSENRNIMMKNSHGKYVLMLDSDILYYPKSFDYLVERLKTAPSNVKNVGFDPWIYTNDEKFVDQQLPSLDKEFSRHGQPLAYTQYGVFDRDLWDKYDIWFDEGFGVGYGAEDNDYAMQMLQQGFLCRCIPFKYYHNKHTEHWFGLHVPDAMRVKERQQYFMDKWGQDVYDKHYGQKPTWTPQEAEAFQLIENGLITQYNKQYKKVVVGVGICPRTEYARDLFMDWYKNQTFKEVDLIIDENSGEENARASRERVVERFLKTESPYLLFCDVDTIPPLDAIERLLKYDKDIVTGLATSRLDQSVLSFWKHGYPEQEDKRKLIKESDGLIEIDGAGLYLTLTKREIVSKLPFHWNSIVDDAEFFMRAQILGYKIYLDPTILCKHYYDKQNYNYPQL